MTRCQPVSPSVRRGRALVALSAAAAATSLLASVPDSASAANYYWDPGLTAPTGAATGGPGTWDTTTPIWDLASADTAWVNNNAAFFNSGTGLVTLGAAITANSLNFGSDGYTIAANASNPLTLNIGTTANPSGALVTTSNTGITTTLSGPIVLSYGTGTGYLNVGATDTLNVTGAVTQTGNGILYVNGGTVNFSGTAFTPFKLSVAGGAVFNTSGTVALTTGTYTGIGDGSAGTLNVSGGTFSTTQTLFLGTGGGKTGTVLVNGGSVTTTSTVNVGDGYNNNSNDIGVITVSSGTFNTGSATGNIRLGNVANGNGTLNLMGGTLSTNSAIAPGTYATASTGTRGSTVNFNGGTLQATGTGLSIANTVTSNVLAGGAKVDSNTFSFTLATNLSSGVAGDGGLTKSGTGTLTVTGSNTYNGNTAINGGTLLATVTGALPGFATAGKISVANGGILGVRTYDATNGPSAFTSSNIDAILAGQTFAAGSAFAFDTSNNTTTPFTYASNITGNQGIQKLGANTLVLTGSNGYAGPTNLSNGLLAVGATSVGPGTLNFNGGSLASSDGTARSFANVVTQNGVATFTFGSPTTYTGSLTFTDTTALNLGSSAARAFAVNAPTTFTQGFSGTTDTLSKSGTATLTLNGPSTLTGTFGIGSGTGTVVLGNSTALGSDTVTVNGQNAATGTLGLAGGITVANAITLAASRNDPTAATPGVAHIENISGNNTISSSGFAVLGGGLGNIFQSDAGTLTFTGNLNGTTAQTAYARPYDLTGAGSGVISGNIANGTSTGGTNLVKYGTGTWTLSGSNGYAGGTQVLAGTLRVSNATGSGTGTGAVTVGDGANASTGVLAGTGTVGNGANPLTILKGGTITAGDGAKTTDAAGSLTSTGAQLWNTGGGYVAKYDGTRSDTLTMTGLTVSSGFVVNFQEKTPGATPGGTYVLAVNKGSSAAGSFNLGALTLQVNGGAVPAGYTFSDVVDSTSGFDTLDLNVTATPEPTSLLLAGLAAAPLALGRRRRSRGKPAV